MNPPNTTSGLLWPAKTLCRPCESTLMKSMHFTDIRGMYSGYMELSIWQMCKIITSKEDDFIDFDICRFTLNCKLVCSERMFLNLKLSRYLWTSINRIFEIRKKVQLLVKTVSGCLHLMKYVKVNDCRLIKK